MRIIYKSYTADDYYESYMRFVDGNPLYITERAIYRDIIADYFKFLADEIIERGKEIKIPARLGTLKVIKWRPKFIKATGVGVDFKATKEYGKRILNLNEHSGGWKYRFFWSKALMINPFRSHYELRMTRANKRRLAELIKTRQQDYIEK